MDLKMKEIRRKELLAGIMLLAAFVLWTVLIRHVDVQNAGPLCNRIRSIYGYRQADLRRSLGNGYCRLCFPELWSIYDLSVHGRLFCLKESDSEDGGIRWSSMRSYNN